MSEIKHTPAQMHAVRDALAETLGDAYDCTRVWSAWGVGTMSQDDFVPVAEDDDRLHELTIAALDASGAAELLEALIKAEKALTKLATIDCGCVPCHGSCRTGRGAEIELEARMDMADEAAHDLRAAIAKATGSQA
jgi:hypothetical protein